MEEKLYTKEELEAFRYNNKFLRIATTLAIWVLLIVMLWAGYQQYSFQHKIGTNYCYACGYYEGKSCQTAYFPKEFSTNMTLREEMLRALGDLNARNDPISMDDKKFLDDKKPIEMPNLSFNEAQ